MPRPQFTLKTMLWVMAVAGAFLSGRFFGLEDVKRKEQERLAKGSRKGVRNRSIPQVAVF
jgi:hypothetical protein